jgi:hypothetical protein
MSSLSRVGAATIPIAWSMGMAGTPSCGTDAVGVDDCRKIESARCEAAVHCEGSFDVADVDACKRYYRDHCLHGLRIADRPGSPVLNRCVVAINAAGDCAAEDADMMVAACANKDPKRLVDQPDTSLESVCDLIEFPERTAECSFLAPEPEPPPATSEDSTAGSGGAAGAGGATTAGGEG